MELDMLVDFPVFQKTVPESWLGPDERKGILLRVDYYDLSSIKLNCSPRCSGFRWLQRRFNVRVSRDEVVLI